MRLIPLALVASAVAAPLSAQWTTSVAGYDICRPIWREYGRMMHGHADAVYCEVREIGAFKPTAAIEVDGGDRSGVTVQGSPRVDARVRLVIQAQGRTVEDAKALAQRATLDLNARPLRISGIDEERRSDDHFVAAIILIDAPEKSDLTVRVNYAPLAVEGVAGKMDVRAAYGPLTLRNVAGDVRARVDHGPLTVELTDAHWQGAGLDAEADYGPMTLRVPRDFNADLEIGAENGPMDVDFPLTLTRLDGRRIRTKLGSGGAPVRAVADYGPFSLQVTR
ncbi:MAG TPA: hypothetical protein VKH19_12260 [Gemmatimonadaceae bacterium]|nr:hypothetical protein [Gemmatimonadaceae bacterium]